jgi:hypothetical protein
MLGLTPAETGALIHAAQVSVLLVLSAALVWLHNRRYAIRGLVRKARCHL